MASRFKATETRFMELIRALKRREKYDTCKHHCKHGPCIKCECGGCAEMESLVWFLKVTGSALHGCYHNTPTEEEEK